MSSENTSEKRPKVSVAMITYNHEKFIEQAIRSVMMQQTDFDYELIVGEDCSTDQTRDILLRLKVEFGDKIRLILHDKNVGMFQNFRSVIQSCRGDFVATLEGDDYWIADKKLSKQVDYLILNPDVSMCFHPVFRSYDDLLTEIVEAPQNAKGKYTFREYITTRPLIPTASMLYRRTALVLPEWLNKVLNLDTAIHHLLADQGALGYIGDVMAVHIVHIGGVWSYLHAQEKAMQGIITSQYLNAHFEYKYKNIFRIRELRAQLALVSAKSHQRKTAIVHLWEMLNTKHGGIPSAITVLKVVLALIPGIPELHYALRSAKST